MTTIELVTAWGAAAEALPALSRHAIPSQDEWRTFKMASDKVRILDSEIMRRARLTATD